MSMWPLICARWFLGPLAASATVKATAKAAQGPEGKVAKSVKLQADPQKKSKKIHKVQYQYVICMTLNINQSLIQFLFTLSGSSWPNLSPRHSNHSASLEQLDHGLAPCKIDLSSITLERLIKPAFSGVSWYLTAYLFVFRWGICLSLRLVRIAAQHAWSRWNCSAPLLSKEWNWLNFNSELDQV